MCNTTKNHDLCGAQGVYNTAPDQMPAFDNGIQPNPLHCYDLSAGSQLRREGAQFHFAFAFDDSFSFSNDFSNVCPLFELDVLLSNCLLYIESPYTHVAFSTGSSHQACGWSSTAWTCATWRATRRQSGRAPSSTACPTCQWSGGAHSNVHCPVFTIHSVHEMFTV